MNISRHKKMVVLAFDKGYRVVDGIPFGSRGVSLKGGFDQKGYRTISVRCLGGRSTFPVKAHCLVAYQKYGTGYINCEHVRHLDGNPLNNREENIAIGTMSDNRMDMPELSRKSLAAKANRQHSDKTVRAWREAHLSGKSYNQISKEFGVCKSTLSFYLSKTAKLTSWSNPIDESHDSHPIHHL